MSATESFPEWSSSDRNHLISKSVSLATGGTTTADEKKTDTTTTTTTTGDPGGGGGNTSADIDRTVGDGQTVIGTSELTHVSVIHDSSSSSIRTQTVQQPVVVEEVDFATRITTRASPSSVRRRRSDPSKIDADTIESSSTSTTTTVQQTNNHKETYATSVRQRLLSTPVVQQQWGDNSARATAGPAHDPGDHTIASRDKKDTEAERTQPSLHTNAIELHNSAIAHHTQQQQQQQQHSTVDTSLSRHIMGMNNNTSNNNNNALATYLPAAFNIPDDIEEDKMENSTQRTESERTFNTSELLRETEDDDDTTIDSVAQEAAPATPLYAPETHVSMLETPSTTSTAPLTDDMDGAGMGLGAVVPPGTTSSAAYQQHHHQRVPSWEGLTLPVHSLMPSPQEQQGYYNAVAQQQPHLPSLGAWGPPPRSSSVGSQQPHATQRVASFRSDQQQRFPPMAPPPSAAPGSNNRWQPQHQHRYSDTQLPFVSAGDNRAYHSTQQLHHHHHQQQQQQHQQGHFQPFQMHDRRSGGSFASPPLPPTLTPPRTRGSRAPPGTPQHRSTPPSTPGSSSSGGGGGGAGGGGSRSSSEILKTLLRKKACLYEPDTSRAVTLITWLVGRHLALENGFFSRQQLQAGVHSCIAPKIESGVITRTKVNRCMQIILNSCFHYIIPRPDGTEEKGASFRQTFANEVSDDDFLLKTLPAPWTNMVVDKAALLKASLSDDIRQGGGKFNSPMMTPQTSPRLDSANAPADKGSPGAESAEGDKDETKRAVLLCFNENVRCAEDVFRCHNEFIRDTAHTSNLQLSSYEWRLFFGKEAASAPYLWGNIGIPVTHLEGQDPNQTDALGVMTNRELAFFRTSWCAKRYDHNHELCGFAHSEVNGGWLRRNPNDYGYKDEMCPSVSKLSHERSGAKVLILNECPQGVDCPFAHSIEEVLYHPRRYKGQVCPSSTRHGGCKLGDACSRFHSYGSYRFPKKSEARSPRHSRSSQQASANKGSTLAPNGAPVLYASPAPKSSFEKQLLTPGLKSLYRRHCSVARALVRIENQRCFYSYFGDDDGLTEDDEPEVTKPTISRPRASSSTE